MSPSRKKNRLPSVMVLLGVAAVVYCFAVLKPQSRRAAGIGRTLMPVWEKLLATNQSATATLGVDLANCDDRLRALQRAGANLHATERTVETRIQLPKELRDRMAEPFTLISYQNERHTRTTQLAALAREQGVALEPGALNGLPEYAADMPAEALLWPRLQLADQLLATAIRCKVSAIRNLVQLPAGSYRVANRLGALHELGMRLELVGPMEAVNRFLATLPLQGQELQLTGQAQALTNKPPIFIDQILVRKCAPDKPLEAQLEVTVFGFVLSRSERPRVAVALP